MRLILCLLFFSTGFFFGKAQSLHPQENGSKVHFVIKNFGIKTGGDFSGLKGSIKFDPANIAVSSFDVSVSSTTINTGNDTRDGHLKKEEYFNVKKYPDIRIASTSIQKGVSENEYVFTGNITIKDFTRPIRFPFTAVKKDNGYLFSADDIMINRRDFNVGGSSISMADELKLFLSVFAK